MTDNPQILVLFGSAVIFGAERGNLEALCSLKEHGAEVLCLIRDETWSTIVPPALDERGIASRKVPYMEQWRRSRMLQVLIRNPFAFLMGNWKLLRICSEFRPTHIHTYFSVLRSQFHAYSGILENASDFPRRR